MKIKKQYLTFEYLCLSSILFLISLKLIFSYLLVEPSWWLRHLPRNYDRFNFLNLPQNFSSNIEYILIPLLLTYIISNYRFLNRLKITFGISLMLLSLNIITSLLNKKTIFESLSLSLKLISPIYFFIVLVTFSVKYNYDLKKLMLKFFRLCFFLIIIGLLFFNISMNRMEVQWPIYFSNIHTHSYIIISIFMGFSYVLYRKRKFKYLLAFFTISLLTFYIGYNVRTALMVYLIYVFIALFLMDDFFKYLWLQVLVLIPIILLFGFLALQTVDVNKVSSGRIEMYSEKYKILKDYNLVEISFGRGTGSDLIKTESWWWEEKGSHSDMLTYLVENGILYLFGFIILIMSVLPSYKRLNLIFFAAILGYFLSSLISNGIAVRPLAGYIFFLFLAYLYIDVTNRNHSSSINFKF